MMAFAMCKRSKLYDCPDPKLETYVRVITFDFQAMKRNNVKVRNLVEDLFKSKVQTQKRLQKIPEHKNGLLILRRV